MTPVKPTKGAHTGHPSWLMSDIAYGLRTRPKALSLSLPPSFAASPLRRMEAFGARGAQKAPRKDCVQSVRWCDVANIKELNGGFRKTKQKHNENTHQVLYQVQQYADIFGQRKRGTALSATGKCETAVLLPACKSTRVHAFTAAKQWPSCLRLSCCHRSVSAACEHQAKTVWRRFRCR